MKYPWIDEYLLNKRSVTKDLQSDWNWIPKRAVSCAHNMRTSCPVTI